MAPIVPKTQSYSADVANQQAALNAVNFGKTPGYVALKVDGILGPKTQDAIGKYSTPASKTDTTNTTPTNPTSSDTPLPRVTPPSGAPTTAPTPETNPGTAPFDTTVPLPKTESEDDTYKRLLSQSNDVIQSVNDTYKTELEKAHGSSAEAAAAAGLGGSSAAIGMDQRTAAPILAQRDKDLATINDQIQQNAQTLNQQEVTNNETSYQDKLTAQALSYSKATDSIKALAAGHTDWGAYKKNNPDNYKALVQSVGGDPNVADAMFAMSIPAQNVLSTTINGRSALVVSQDPVTGKVQSNTYDLGVDIPSTWTAFKLGTNATRFEGPNYNPNDPSTYTDVTSDPTNGGAITQTVNGKTMVNGVPINDSPSSESGNTTPAAPTVASLIGINDPSVPLSSVVGNVNIGVDGIVNGIVANEGGSPKGVVNNPGNIKFVGQTGATDSGIKASDGGTFASFPTKQDGLQAISKLVSNAADKGENFDDFINKYTGTTPVPGKDYKQVGLLANTDYNPQNETDKNALNYLDAYLKSSNGTLPSAASLFGSSRGSAQTKFVEAQDRAKQLFYDATGNSLPDEAILKSNKTLVTSNNKLLNNLSMQEGTVGKNFALTIDNLDKNGINQNSQPINSFLDNIKNLMGDPDVAQYITQNGTLQNEVGNLIAIKNASGTTVADKLASAGLVPKNASEEQQKSILKILLKEAQNGVTTIQGLNSDLYKQIDPLEQNTQNPNRQNNSNPTSRGSMTAADFVEKTLTAHGLKYDDVIKEKTPQLQAGEKLAIRNSDGSIVAVSSTDDPNSYTPL